MAFIELTRRGFCRLIGLFCLGGSLGAPCRAVSSAERNPHNRKGGGKMRLPDSLRDGGMSLERAIDTRRTIRSFTEKPLTLEQLSQLLWAAQGITEKGGYKRAAPSAGALYPMDVYLALGKGCAGKLNPGVYHYEPDTQSISPVKGGDVRRDIALGSLGQMWMAEAPLTIVITAEYERSTGKYGRRGIRYSMIEAGHIGQNLFLQARAMGLEAGIVGAFEDSKIIKIMGIEKTHEPLLIMPVGYKG